MESSMVLNPLAEYPSIAARYDSMATDAVELDVGWNVVGDGGVMASPTAMAEWFDVIRTGLPDYPGIADAMLEGAVEVQDAGDTTYGAGVFITPDGSVWHTGGWEGHSSYLSISADRSTTIAVACNSDEGGLRLPGIIQGLGEIW
jgi:hypothetical protein